MVNASLRQRRLRVAYDSSDGGEHSFFAEFDGIVDAELATGMNHDRVRQLIMDTAATANGSAAIASPSPPPDSAAVVVIAEVHSSPSPPSRQLRQCPKPTEYLTYDDRGMQVDLMEYRGD